VSTAYAPVPIILPATITLPQDLVDQRTAASVNVPFANLADAIAYLQLSINVIRRKGCGAPIGAVRSGAIAKTFDLQTVRLDSWETKLFTCYGGSMRCPTPDAGNLAIHLCYDITDLVIHGATVTRLTLDLIGNTGTHSALPGMMPALGMARHNPNAGTWESLLAAGMQDDTSGGVVAYESAHEIRLSADQNATVDTSTYAYYAIVCPEGGADAEDGLQFRSLSVRQTTPRYTT
jgi:hypothetical protein